MDDKYNFFMSADPRRLEAQRHAAIAQNANDNTKTTRFLKELKAPLLVQETSAVSHVHFNLASPHDLAFTSSTRVQILDAETQQVRKTFARFKNTVYSGEFRFDGKLLAAGDGGGLVQCFDTTTKAVLVTLQASKRAVRCTKFHPTSKSTLLTAGDDQSLRLWELSSPDPIVEYNDMHGDYIRAAAFLGTNLMATGCYDGIVRLFDPRVSKSVMQFDLEQPVESVTNLNYDQNANYSSISNESNGFGSMLAAAAGNKVKIFDIVSKRMISSLGNFQKTVTCVTAVPSGLLASSLDGHVKLFSPENLKFETVFGWKYGGPVLSAAMSPDQRQLAAGLTTGLLSVRTRKKKKENLQEKKERTLNQQNILRGSEYHGEHEQQVLRVMQKPRIKPKLCEKLVKSFRWSDALDAALRPGVSVEQTQAVLEDLRARGKIQVSLYDRDVSGLEPVLKWCIKQLSDPRHVDVASDWIVALVDMHQETVEESPALASLVGHLTKVLKEQVENAEEAQLLEGMIELLIA